MANEIKECIYFMNWITEVAEEKIVEHRLLKTIFNSHEEFIIFTIIWMRVYKALCKKIKIDFQNNRIKESKKLFDEYIKNFYENQKDIYLGMTINAVSRESTIPRSTVKRAIDQLISRGLIKKNDNGLIIPTSKVRSTMEKYRKHIFQSNNKLYELFNNFDLNNKSYSDVDTL